MQHKLSDFNAETEYDRSDDIYRAELCYTTDMFADMTKFMKRACKVEPKQNDQEREMLNTAYKSVTNPLRTAWKKLKRIEERLEANDSLKTPIIREYKSKIEAFTNCLYDLKCQKISVKKNYHKLTNLLLQKKNEKDSVFI